MEPAEPSAPLTSPAASIHDAPVIIDLCSDDSDEEADCALPQVDVEGLPTAGLDDSAAVTEESEDERDPSGL